MFVMKKRGKTKWEGGLQEGNPTTLLIKDTDMLNVKLTFSFVSSLVSPAVEKPGIYMMKASKCEQEYFQLIHDKICQFKLSRSAFINHNHCSNMGSISLKTIKSTFQPRSLCF